MKPLTYLGLLLLALWAAPRLQDEPPPLTAHTEMVMLPVTVVDSGGRYVSGLTGDEFAVFDAGQSRTIEFFASGEIPATIGLVIDSSMSMRTARDQVTAAAMAFVALGHPGDEFFTLNFNERVWPGLPHGTDFTAEAAVLRGALAAAPARGMTALFDALDEGLVRIDRGRHDRKALIVVSDGGDNASIATYDTVLHRARRSGTPIYAVILADEDDHSARPGLLRRLARETGATAFTPDTPAEIGKDFVELARDLRNGYLIGFEAPEAGGTGFHPVRVAVMPHDGRALTARTRAGYYAADAAPE